MAVRVANIHTNTELGWQTCTLLRFDIALTWSLIPTFRENLSVQGTYRLFRNVNNKLPFYAAYNPRRVSSLATKNDIFRLINEIINSQNRKTKIGSVFLRFAESLWHSKSWFTAGQAIILWNKRESYKINRILPLEKIPGSKLLHKAQVIRHYQTG